MPRVRDLLYRFRPAGAPGPASAAAVPADHAADRAAELEPVFAVLAETEARCAALREEAGRAAQGRRDRARETARSLVQDAEARAPSERADAAARVAAEAAGESTATLDAAHAEAARLLERAAGRTPVWAARVADEVDQLIGGGAEASR